MQKVAEFNGEYSLFGNLDAEAKIFKIAELRNKRIETTKRIFELDDMIYHCVGRKPNGIIVHESLMHTIAIDKINSIVVKKNAISFNDGLNEYSFNNPKSTLFKRFITESPILDISVKILENPFEELEKLLVKEFGEIVFSPIKKQEHIFLPLYSAKDDEKYVPEKSGLNQWNASGRRRDPNEIYIPIPAWINKKYPNFFPPRDESFQMVLPNKNEMSAKLCQDGSKALMSNPNAALGKWLLRDVLNLKELELLSYDKLEEIGLDSVVIYKTEDGKYDIDFTNVNSFEDFYESSKRV
jgi:hypothetical protein